MSGLWNQNQNPLVARIKTLSWYEQGGWSPGEETSSILAGSPQRESEPEAGSFYSNISTKEKHENIMKYRIHKNVTIWNPIAALSFNKALYCLLRKHTSKIIIIQVVFSSTHKRFVKRLPYIVFEKYKQTFTKYRYKDHKLKIETRRQIQWKPKEEWHCITLGSEEVEIFSDLLSLHKNKKLGEKIFNLSKIVRHFLAVSKEEDLFNCGEGWQKGTKMRNNNIIY